MNVVLDIERTPIWIEEEQNISCGSMDSEVESAEIYFPQLKIRIFKIFSVEEFQISSTKGNKTVASNKLPLEIGVLILRRAPGRNLLQVTLKAKPKINGFQVLCLVKSVSSVPLFRFLCFNCKCFAAVKRQSRKKWDITSRQLASLREISDDFGQVESHKCSLTRKNVKNILRIATGTSQSLASASQSW